MNTFITHTFPPVYNKHSKILLLGTMPSPKSREYGFYYSHPQNRLWPILAELLSCPLPKSNKEKKMLLLNNHIAMWDVLQSCNIKGADDQSIHDPVVNDFSIIFNTAQIQAVFTTGTKATALYKKYCFPANGKPSFYLPSTSPANCRNYTFETLKDAYRVILDYLI